MKANYKYEVIPRGSRIAFLLLLLGFGMLLSTFVFFNKIWTGYIIAGILMQMFYKWRYIEIKPNRVK